MATELISCSSDDELAQRAARAWLEELCQTKKRPYCVALSGGRIARVFFQAIVRSVRERRVALNEVHFFWGDERCVAPDDPESNFGLAQRELFVPLRLAHSEIHRIRGELEPAKAATEAITELCQRVRLNAAGVPVFDMVFLGMGEDGHVASLFPSEAKDWLSRPDIYYPVEAKKPPPKRITLNMTTLVAADQVWVLAAGPGKEWALRTALAKTGDTPLAHLLRRRAQTQVWSAIRLPSDSDADHRQPIP